MSKGKHHMIFRKKPPKVTEVDKLKNEVERLKKQVKDLQDQLEAAWAQNAILQKIIADFEAEEAAEGEYN